MGVRVSVESASRFHDGFLFQAWNTVYVLLGDGLRKGRRWKRWCGFSDGQ
ncbi:DUF6957 family protein [Atopomonas sediminilitoris]